MADEKIKFDKWEQVEAAIKKSSIDADKSSGGGRLVSVLFAQSWNPPSLHMAKEFEKLRKAATTGKTAVTTMFIVDLDTEVAKAAEKGVVSGPAMLFFVGGEALTIRRPGWADDDKFVGSCSKENLMELLQYARSADNEGSKQLYIDF